MKRGISTLLIAALVACMLCGGTVIAAAGAEPTVSGIYGLTVANGYTVTPQTAAGGTVSATAATISGSTVQFYAEAVRFQVSYTGTNNTDQHLILVLSGESAVPTADNMVYINQTAATGESYSIIFSVYPSTVGKGTYHIYVSKTNGTGLVEIASFSGYQAYTLGDVDDDGKFTATDALYALQMSVGNGTWSDTQKLSANVDGDQQITATDALFILQRSVGNRTSFES